MKYCNLLQPWALQVQWMGHGHDEGIQVMRLHETGNG